jgi:hypothetical protein
MVHGRSVDVDDSSMIPTTRTASTNETYRVAVQNRFTRAMENRVNDEHRSIRRVIQQVVHRGAQRLPALDRTLVIAEPEGLVAALHPGRVRLRAGERAGGDAVRVPRLAQREGRDHPSAALAWRARL